MGQAASILWKLGLVNHGTSAKDLHSLGVSGQASPGIMVDCPGRMPCETDVKFVRLDLRVAFVVQGGNQNKEHLNPKGCCPGLSDTSKH